MVCLYASTTGGLNFAQGEPLINLPTHGFNIGGEADGTGDTFIYWTWAYTAP